MLSGTLLGWNLAGRGLVAGWQIGGSAPGSSVPPPPRMPSGGRGGVRGAATGARDREELWPEMPKPHRFCPPACIGCAAGQRRTRYGRRSFLHPVSSAPSSAGLSEPRRHLIMRVVARPLLRACLCAVVLQQAVWASALRLQLGTATAMRSGGCSGHSDVVCWGRRSMCASASDEEPAAEVQSYADRPLMFTDRESEKVGDKGAATLAPEAAVMDPPVDLSGMDQILKQLESIQKGTPKNIVMLGTRHCSLLHQQIIELLSYALVLSTHRRSQKSGRRAGLAPVPPKAGHPPSPLPLPPTHPPTPANRLRGPPDRPRARLRRPSTVSAEILFISAATGSAPLPPPYRRLTAALPPPYRHPQATTTSTPRARRARTPPPSAVDCST